MTAEEHKNWHALYLRPRSEKKVYKFLSALGIEAYLPLQRKLKKWSDRKKIVEEPLFRSYIFVRVNRKDYFLALNADGAIKYVTFEGKAAIIPGRQIEMVRRLLEQNYTLEVTGETIPVGEMVEITMGSMMGLVGAIVEHKGLKKVVVRIDHISHSLLVTLPKEYVVRAIQF